MTASLPWAADAVAQRMLVYLQVAYPIVLLLVSLVAFTISSISTARVENDATPQSQQFGQVEQRRSEICSPF